MPEGGLGKESTPGDKTEMNHLLNRGVRLTALGKTPCPVMFAQWCLGLVPVYHQSRLFLVSATESSRRTD